MESRLLQAFKYPGNKEKVRELLPLVDDPKRVKDAYSQNLLHFAGDRGWQDIVETLIVQYHFDPCYEDEFGGTVLGDVCARGHAELALYLVRKWCVDPTKKDVNGKNPIDEARSWNHNEVVDSLQSIVDEAKGKGYEDVKQFLKDQLAEEALTKAMESGGGKLLQSNITMHGAPGAGKTSVKRLIAGMPPLQQMHQTATDIMERAVRAVCTSMMKGFKVIDNQELFQLLAEEIENQRICDDKAQHIEAISEGEIEPSSVTNQNPVKEGSASSVVSTLSNPPSITAQSSGADVEILQQLYELLKTVKPTSSMFESYWFHLVDSGGQPQFLDILPLVYSCASLFIFVMRLTEELDEKPPVRFYSKGKVSYTLPNHLCLTNREMIVHTCQIACSAASDSFTPQVMIVATYKDKLGIESESRIRKLNQSLARERKEFDNVLICKSADETVFALNAVAEGKEREIYANELQGCIMENVKRTVKPIDMPLKWLAFHLNLDMEGGVVEKSECIKGGRIFSMSEADVDNVLQYLNQAALLLYFPDALPNLILTKMEPFIGKLSKLVKASFVPQEYRPIGQSRKLREKGLFDKKFLQEIFGDVKKGDLNEDQFLKLLLHLKIAVCVEEDVFFLPSALSLDVSPEPFHQTESNPLAFTWDKCILPHGFFFTVVIELLNYCESTYKFSFGLRTNVAQSREEIQITEVNNRLPGVIKLANKKSWIQVWYSDDVHYCFHIFKAVEVAIQKTVHRFKSMGIRSPKVAFLCPFCDSKDHYCTVTYDNRKIVCSVNEMKTGPLKQNMICWTEAADVDRSIATDGLQKIDQSPPSLPPIDDSQLSEKDLLAVLEVIQGIVKWQDLGLQLGLPHRVLDDIYAESSQSISDCRRKMACEWIKTKENASWCTLAHALNGSLVNRSDLVRQIAEKHPRI